MIDDSYNANPDSMYASLSNLYKTKSKLHNYKTVLIIGDMLELGKKSMIKHLELIPIIKKINPNYSKIQHCSWETWISFLASFQVKHFPECSRKELFLKKVKSLTPSQQKDYEKILHSR